jgi:glyoxylase-like metal-dependent hydrolase (beta-lactamase superfamily II)
MADVWVEEIGGGIHRVTHRLPFALDHVHCYAVAGSDGWTIVDTGLAYRAEMRWREALAALGHPHVRRIVITHYHPDHLGGSATLAELTGAEEILQGRLDAQIAQRVYTDAGYMVEFRRFLSEQGVPAEQIDEIARSEQKLLVPPVVPTRLLDEGDTVVVGDDEYAVLHLPGHADGHIALYHERSGRVFGGDVLLSDITPNVATLHHTEPDPLGRYLTTLDRIIELEPALVCSGHHRALDDPAGRAREIQEHHGTRLDETEAALRAGASTPYEGARRIWGAKLSVHELRFALGETVSHLVRLARLGRAVEVEPGRWRAI